MSTTGKHTMKKTKKQPYVARGRQIISMIRLAAALLPKLQEATKKQNPVAQAKLLSPLALTIDATVKRLDDMQAEALLGKGE